MAENLTAHGDANGDVVFLTLEHAVEVLTPYLSEYMTRENPQFAASILRDDGEPASLSTSQPRQTPRMRKSSTELEICYFPQTDTLYIGNGQSAAEGYDIAENLTAHGDAVFVTHEHAAEVLTPIFS